MIIIDTGKGIVIKDDIQYPLGTPEAFSIISDAWLRCGWDNKYVYSFAWMGRPIIQLPDDLIRIQEVIFRIQPDLIIETGVAHGGSLVYYATLCKVLGKGKVVGIDIEIRAHNRKAIEEHFLFPYITLIEGNSVDTHVVNQVKNLIPPQAKVLAMLDSNHTKDHVLHELRAYGEMISVGSYIVAADGIMEQLVGASRSNADWASNNPKKAAEQFVKENKNFIIEEPGFPFNEGVIQKRVTYWPNAFIKRIA